MQARRREVATVEPSSGEGISQQPAGRLGGVLDRFLPIWILSVMAVGVLLGRLAPTVPRVLDGLHIGSTSLPIALGLLLITYPPLAKVRYTRLRQVAQDRRLLIASLVLNWVIGPAGASASASEAESGMRPASCRGSVRSPPGDYSSPSSCSLPCRAMPSADTPSRSHASLYRCSSTL
ncbi:arsenic resistance protein [Ancrocorticia populi]|uniref:arsenic resistance protein n=1 Tax=Ancrocorticia populi TaxID=2175228 RepID=UPI003F97C4A5